MSLKGIQKAVTLNNSNTGDFWWLGGYNHNKIKNFVTVSLVLYKDETTFGVNERPALGAQPVEGGAINVVFRGSDNPVSVQTDQDPLNISVENLIYTKIQAMSNLTTQDGTAVDFTTGVTEIDL